MEKIKYLLNHVRVISDKYKEIALAKGENFNLFDIMGMRTDEVKTHSAIIAELLNPKGSHDMGAVFLKLFLQKLIPIITQPNDKEKHEYLLNSNLSKTQAIVEFNICQIKENLTEGGRIDILLSNEEFEICIENKINAGDQPYQLRRYYNHLTQSNKTSNKKTFLLYLTPEGKSASIESTCNSIKNEDGIWVKDLNQLIEERKDYFCISYRTEILSWLEECHSLAADKPILRESLKQYILLIRSLTNQATNNDMANELHQTILSDIESAEKIANEFEIALNVETEKFRGAVIDKLKEHPEIEKVDINNFQKIKGLFITPKNALGRIGIESFSGTGHKLDKIKQENSLFIGAVDFDKNPEINKTKGIWILGTVKEIWSKEKYYKKLKQFSQGDENVINELVQEIQTYINDNL